MRFPVCRCRSKTLDYQGGDRSAPGRRGSIQKDKIQYPPSTVTFVRKGERGTTPTRDLVLAPRPITTSVYSTFNLCRVPRLDCPPPNPPPSSLTPAAAGELWASKQSFGQYSVLISDLKNCLRVVMFLRFLLIKVLKHKVVATRVCNKRQQPAARRPASQNET
ncbi:hypothetical protein EVAR_54316_1 [Eumeta japonica]|uniref:Uncharacterized protein n=1 Tax=Eumeta variegata TaxID=151549 RepID=A0A4C1YY94_EUMVA|nr:hypothetical protein EVAR_54316_1 [Eumeta japonica]